MTLEDDAQFQLKHVQEAGLAGVIKDLARDENLCSKAKVI